MNTPARFVYEIMPTPIGDLLVAADDNGFLRVVEWVDHDDRLRLLFERYYGTGAILAEGKIQPRLVKALKAYFGGELAAIDELPAKTAGTPFQEDAWRALRRIPCGKTVSYAEQAQTIGRPKAVRAIGAANGANLVGVVIPCHRVIGANGSLTGYGGGVDRKRWLLAHEGCQMFLI